MWQLITGVVLALVIISFVQVAQLSIVGDRLDDLDARITTVETIRITRPVGAFTIPVIINTSDDAVRYD